MSLRYRWSCDASVSQRRPWRIPSSLLGQALLFFLHSSHVWAGLRWSAERPPDFRKSRTGTVDSLSAKPRGPKAMNHFHAGRPWVEKGMNGELRGLVLTTPWLHQRSFDCMRKQHEKNLYNDQIWKITVTWYKMLQPHCSPAEYKFTQSSSTLPLDQW